MRLFFKLAIPIMVIVDIVVAIMWEKKRDSKLRTIVSSCTAAILSVIFVLALVLKIKESIIAYGLAAFYFCLAILRISTLIKKDLIRIDVLYVGPEDLKEDEEKADEIETKN